MTGPRVLFQSHNRRGLGHLMRGLNLADEVLRLQPTAQVVMHTRNPAAQGFCPSGIECVVDDGVSGASSWPAVLKSVTPDIVVYDTMLPGDGEPEPLPSGARCVYVLRRTRPDQYRDLMTRQFLTRIDAVVVPHDEREFGYRLPLSLAPRAVFAGLIARRPDPARQTDLRNRYDLRKGQPLLVSSAGGGGFAHSAVPFLDAVAAVQRKVSGPGRPPVRHVVVTGPHFTGTPPALSGAVVIAVEPALVDLFALADLVVAEGGYNSVAELRLLRKPAVFLPGHRTLDDQEQRVLALQRQGVAVVLSTHHPDAVADHVVALLDSPARLAEMRSRHASNPAELGNRRAAVHLLGLVA
jgi:predicted glycosyltransferase